MADQSLDILNRLRNLPQYKNSKITDEELLEIYLNRDNASKVKDMAIDDRFIDNTEKKEARTLLRKYLREYTIESTAEKQELSDLIFLEILNKRLQKELNEINDSKKKKDTPVKLIEALHKNLTQIAEKKKILGLFKSQDSSGQDPFSYIQLLKKKFKFWLESNQLSRHFICPHCAKEIWLKLRNDMWETLKHPFLKDRMVCNEELLALYLQERITKKNIARIFGTSEDYIDWVLGKMNPDTVRDLKTKNIDK